MVIGWWSDFNFKLNLSKASNAALIFEKNSKEPVLWTVNLFFLIKRKNRQEKPRRAQINKKLIFNKRIGWKLLESSHRTKNGLMPIPDKKFLMIYVYLAFYLIFKWRSSLSWVTLNARWSTTEPWFTWKMLYQMKCTKMKETELRSDTRWRYWK